jgi:hypothetical protein
VERGSLLPLFGARSGLDVQSGGEPPHSMSRWTGPEKCGSSVRLAVPVYVSRETPQWTTARVKLSRV